MAGLSLSYGKRMVSTFHVMKRFSNIATIDIVRRVFASIGMVGCLFGRFPIMVNIIVSPVPLVVKITQYHSA
jgi:hypothetical protein